MTATAELDIFSGLPNPTHILMPSEEATLNSLVGALTSPPSSIPTPAQLGYRGVPVTYAPPATIGSAMVQGVLALCRTVAVTDTSNVTTYYDDPTGSVEGYLLSLFGTFAGAIATGYPFACGVGSVPPNPIAPPAT